MINLANQLDVPRYRALRYHYIHHSAHQNDWVDKLVNYANNTYFDSGEEAVREMLPNTPGKTS